MLQRYSRCDFVVQYNRVEANTILVFDMATQLKECHAEASGMKNTERQGLRRRA